MNLLEKLVLLAVLIGLLLLILAILQRFPAMFFVIIIGALYCGVTISKDGGK